MKAQRNHLLKECALDESCAYLKGRAQLTHYKVIQNCSLQWCNAMTSRGWRRFGEMFFRPVCKECTACESLKIDAHTYSFSRSEKRVIKKNSDLYTMMRRPTMTTRHLDLFERYHEHMHHKRGWERHPVTPNGYYGSFVNGFNEFGYEVLYFEKHKLIGVDLIDILPTGISSIYFYYDPDYAHRSLGKYSLLRQIVTAKELMLPWIYLGYYVQGCQSLEYKRDYRHLWQLHGRPGDHEEAVWVALPDEGNPLS